MKVGRTGVTESPQKAYVDLAVNAHAAGSNGIMTIQRYN